MKKDKVRWPTQKESFCGPLEVELLVAENKQLRAQVELLTHEKQVALSMWREQRNKNEELCRLLAKRTCVGTAGKTNAYNENKRMDVAVDEGSTDWTPPSEKAQEEMIARRHGPSEQEDDQCFPTSSGRAALQVKGEGGGTAVVARHHDGTASDDSDSQPLVSKRSARRRELFPVAVKKQQQQRDLLSQSPFPNSSAIAKKRKLEHGTDSLLRRERRGERLQESCIAVPTRKTLSPGKRSTSLLDTPQRTPGSSSSANTTPTDSGDEGATGPKDYLCRDCRRRFCRRGDRDNHEQLCGHTKWRSGKSLALGFAPEK